MKLTITPVQYVENGKWFVEACIHIIEILNDEKLVKYFIDEITEDILNVQFRDDFVPLNYFVKLLKKNKSLYNEYKGFIDWAKRDQDYMQRIAKIMYETSMKVKMRGKDAKKYMYNGVSKEILEMVDYLCDRNTKEDLDVNEMASIAWERFTEGFIPQPYEE